jgi:hypothetical protein
MKEFMPDTHADPALIRAYAEKSVWTHDGEELEVQLDFYDIAEDRGPREATTLDAVLGPELGRIATKRKSELTEEERKALRWYRTEQRAFEQSFVGHWIDEVGTPETPPAVGGRARDWDDEDDSDGFEIEG